jgi:dTMP kinase
LALANLGGAGVTGRLIAIEGADGAGKQTASIALAELLKSVGARVIRTSFPGYTKTFSGKVIGDVLAKKSEMPRDQRVLAAIYALDRFESLPELTEQLSASDFVISDRYVASNIAYQVAIARSERLDDIAGWLSCLEFELFKLPRPFVNILLETPLEVSFQFQIEKAGRAYTSDAFDRFESDVGLQKRVREAYRKLSMTSVVGRWLVVETKTMDTLKTPQQLAQEIYERL